MTCIVGLVENNTVYMGGDSAGVAGLDVSPRVDEKVFLVGNRFLIGITGSFRMGNLLRFSLKVPVQKRNQQDFEYMCTTFIDTVRRCFTKGGFLAKDSGDGGREAGEQFLVGYRGMLYGVDVDFQVGINARGFDAVGCGGDFAQGALFATRGLGMLSRKRVELALQAAVEFSGGVRPPFILLELKKNY